MIAEGHDAILSGFLGTLIAGHAVLDRELRFQAINTFLAGINGIPIEAHLGRTVFEILGDVGTLVEPAFHRVLRTGEALLNVEVTGKLPTKTEVAHWIWNYLPVLTATGEVEQIGIVVIETTPTQKIGEMLLSAFLQQQTEGLAHSNRNAGDAWILLRSSLALTTPRFLLENLGLRPFGNKTARTLTLDEVCREHIVRVLRETEGRVSGLSGAAAKLGLKRTTLQSKMEKLMISRRDYTLREAGSREPTSEAFLDH